ncbi:hypothetical protein C8Q74DRAFT_1170633, partial [Fomes fomentarius]
MDASELGRWTRFAEQAGDLMFLKASLTRSPTDDEITVLMQLPAKTELFLVSGITSASAVRFHGWLKKPVLTKHQS